MYNCDNLYQEFRSKHGFDDGESIPLGAKECRDLLVEAINALSPDDAYWEAYGYDRAGMHNAYLILYRSKSIPHYDIQKDPDEVRHIIEALDEIDYLFSVTEVVIKVEEPFGRKRIVEIAREALRSLEAEE
jgi:hypothetical protein